MPQKLRVTFIYKHSIYFSQNTSCNQKEILILSQIVRTRVNYLQKRDYGLHHS